MKRDPRPTAVDLFAGAGGLSLGLKNAGFRVIGAVELNEGAAKSYALNHSDVPLHACDVAEVTGPEILRRGKVTSAELDLLAACPPCQGFSSIRTRNARRSARDDRNALIHQVTRLVRSLRPRAILLENVPSVRRSKHFKRFVSDLQRAAYTCEWSIVDASGYGVPQRRKRLVFIAVREGSVPKVRKSVRVVTVSDAIGGLKAPSRSRDALHAYSIRISETVMERIRAVPQNGGSRHELPERLQLDCHQKTTGFRDVYGRMSWKSPAPTLTGGCINPSKGRFIHPSEHRPITLREASLLQGFPRSYQFDTSHGRYAAALQIGNAVPPPLARKHGSAILRSLRKAKRAH